MGWPYGFPALSHEEKQLRRQALDFYACMAHYSALAPALVFLLYRVSRRVVYQAGRASASNEQGRYAPLPRSPVVRAHQQGTASASDITIKWRRLTWWLGDDVYFAGSHCGQWDEWVIGALWTAWLLVLTVKGTGNDYFHLTKRLGAIAVSQLPIQYLLALKALNPFAWAFRSSHEHVNRYHRVLGRIIYGLLLLHLILYNAYFIYAGIWLRRIFNPAVFCGVVASLGFHGIVATATRAARKYSYRIFFITHLVVAMLMPVLLFFHASSARFFIVEAVVIFIADLAVRRVTTIDAPSTLETIPGTALVKITSSIPAHKLANFRAIPGSHIYLSIPPSSRTTTVPASKSGVVDYLHNPLTVAAVDERHGTISFVARVRSGPMTNILSAFSSAASQPTMETRKTVLGIEGPYGTMAARFGDLLSWGPSRVLLVSGGVGATFTLPIYHALQSELPSAKLQLIWAIRGAGDATWAVSDATTGRSVLEDPSIQLFLTGDMGVADDREDADAGGDVELSQLRRSSGRVASKQNRKRPDFEKIVDDIFRQGSSDSVAVVVCGPWDMTREVRQRVGPWARKGRRVWWHSETFGW
ncbi:hypothetical protein EsDP_00003009 [Epichloe bromicola]|uniref:FAD-binding FR-type domain-containing protein n=1 Tax=Epichloe bromicola TaxID=79588 RepID=A0ABQ0CN04_9HYPO